ncbi:MAG: hypothetical protein KTR31_32720 [Myxococcales bacterium]|nr:hypothetical protein [Myxococcales bacterium]
MHERSPSIVDSGWGTVEVDGWGTFRDAKLFPGGAREWDWDETGTQHRPGIQVADVVELIASGARVVVLSQGRNERLGVPAKTVDWLCAQGVGVHVLPTPEAIDTYNALASSERVAALIHSTC